MDDQVLIEQYWQEIVHHYSGKDRHYHNLRHIEDLLSRAAAYKQQIEDYDVLRFSIWYHDIIYNALRKDNEAQSAALAEKRLLKTQLASARIQRCVQQIILTQKHNTADQPTDEQYLIDFDLSILGSSWENYVVYTKNIRREYHWYPAFAYKKGRQKAMLAFLERKRIYQTDAYFGQYEEIARENIRKEVNLLS